MTEPQDSSNKSDYYEFHYPHVLPEVEIASVLTPADLSTLTPLEKAFVLWFIETGNAEVAFNRLIHPAHYMNLSVINYKMILSRPLVQDVIKKVKKDCQYLKLYSLDYIAGVLHDEVQYLRKTNREPRLYGEKANEAWFLGKKSRHQEELDEIKLLKEYLELLVRMNDVVREHELSRPQSSSAGNSIDRILDDARKSILERETKLRGEAGGGLTPIPPG